MPELAIVAIKETETILDNLYVAGFMNRPSNVEEYVMSGFHSQKGKILDGTNQLVTMDHGNNAETGPIPL